MATWTGILGNILLFMLCFGMSATVEIDRMQQQARNYKALATGILCQFLVLPFLGFLVVRTLDLPESLGLTLLVVTSSPGGSYSNWWCSVFNADLALSVTMTALSTILSILFLPANLLLYTRLTYHDDGLVSVLDWSSLFIALGVVLTAVAAGLTCSYYNKDPSIQKMANHLGNFAGFALIVFSATMTNTGDADSKIWSRDWKFYVGVSLPCLGGLLLANLIGTALQLRRPERVTVAIECCYQNVREWECSARRAKGVCIVMWCGRSHANCLLFFCSL
jgi:predicted Na+-dependent transporter